MGLEGCGSQEVGLEGRDNQEVCLEGDGSQDPVEPHLRQGVFSDKGHFRYGSF